MLKINKQANRLSNILCKKFASKQTNDHENNNSLMEETISGRNRYVFVIREISLKYDYRKHSGRVKVKSQTKVTP